MQTDLWNPEPIYASKLRTRISELAAQGVFLGTSSWKYRGWCGQLYDESRYAFRGRFAESRFEAGCLVEYAETFKTVCVDAAYYAFPIMEKLQRLAAQVPKDFQFGFKVTDEITVKRFPQLPKFGARAGELNPNFLNADLFLDRFLRPCQAIREQVGIIMFEFSRFHRADFDNLAAFLEFLPPFLKRLPRDWPFGIEMRNQDWLVPDYFNALTSCNVAHVFNSWEAMPSLADQMALPGSATSSSLAAARLLLKPGRKYADAKQTFQPYDKVQEINSEARKAGALLARQGRKAPGKKTFIFVNNRLEGNALGTIEGILEQLDLLPPISK